MVNLSQALDLYLLVGPHLPDKMGDSIYEFTSIILKNMIASGCNASFIDSIQLMTDIPEAELLQKTSQELNYLFAKGLLDNDILDLRDFMRSFLNVTFD